MIQTKSLHLISELTTSNLRDFRKWEEGFEAFWEGWGRDVIVSKLARNGWDCAQTVHKLSETGRVETRVTLEKKRLSEGVRQLFAVRVEGRFSGSIIKVVTDHGPVWQARSHRGDWLGEMCKKGEAIRLVVGAFSG